MVGKTCTHWLGIWSLHITPLPPSTCIVAARSAGQSSVVGVLPTDVGRVGGTGGISLSSNTMAKSKEGLSVKTAHINDMN